MALASIVHDYAYTVALRAAGVSASWDLHASLRPARVVDAPLSLPNRNLLGWSPSKKMTEGQLKLSCDNEVYAAVANRNVTFIVHGVENRAGPIVPETTD